MLPKLCKQHRKMDFQSETQNGTLASLIPIFECLSFPMCLSLHLSFQLSFIFWREIPTSGTHDHFEPLRHISPRMTDITAVSTSHPWSQGILQGTVLLQMHRYHRTAAGSAAVRGQNHLQVCYLQKQHLQCKLYKSSPDLLPADDWA